LHLVHKSCRVWEGVCVADSVGVEVSVVLAWAEVSILLWDEEEGGCLWRF
jgi:hypothetical protein